MTPEQEKALLDATALGLDNDLRAAYHKLLALIDEGMAPREAIQAVQREFRGQYAQLLADGFSAILERSVGSEAVLAMKVSGVTLSQRLYQQSREVSATVAGMIDRHVKGFDDARKLTLALYEGYGFKPSEALNLSPRNPKLPKYLRRELLTDPTLRGDLARHFASVQAGSLKTPALKAAYLQYLKGIEKGSGQNLLERRLQVAYHERMRYFANRIAQTELHRAYTERQSADLLADKEVQYVQIRLSATHPVTDICDLIAEVDRYGLGPGVYPVAEAPVPPFHPHCLSGDALITSAVGVSSVTKRWHDGDMVTITTASGKCLTATINHPILTGRGWVGAGLLNVGDEVVARVGAVAERGYSFRDDDHQHMPASIAEIADAFFGSGKVSAREVPVSAEDFHGDGVGSDVAVVGAYRKLWDRVDSAALEVAHHHALQVADPGAAGLLGERVLDLGCEALGDASNGGMGLTGKGQALFWSGLRQSQRLGLAASAPLDAEPVERGVDAAARKAEAPGNGQAGFPGKVCAGDTLLHIGLDVAAVRPREDSGFGETPDGDAGLAESQADAVSADAVLAAQILEGKTGLVVLDALVKVERFAWCGHVYNLETEHGHYTGNGIITHNCRCMMSPRLDLYGKKPRFRPGAEREWLRQQGGAEAAQVMGSRARRDAVLKGADPLEAWSERSDPMYRVRRIGVAIGLESSGANASIDSVKSAYDIAKEGGRHKGLYQRNLEKRTPEIEKSIRSLASRVSEHEDKIANPRKYVRGELPDYEVAHLVEKFWPKEIRKFNEEIAVLNGILKERK